MDKLLDREDGEKLTLRLLPLVKRRRARNSSAYIPAVDVLNEMCETYYKDAIEEGSSHSTLEYRYVDR